jgi:hypothetical protein
MDIEGKLDKQNLYRKYGDGRFKGESLRITRDLETLRLNLGWED